MSEPLHYHARSRQKENNVKTGKQDSQVKGPLYITTAYLNENKERNNNKPNLPLQVLVVVEHTSTDDCQQSTGLGRPRIITIMAAASKRIIMQSSEENEVLR